MAVLGFSAAISPPKYPPPLSLSPSPSLSLGSLGFFQLFDDYNGRLLNGRYTRTLLPDATGFSNHRFRAGLIIHHLGAGSGKSCKNRVSMARAEVKFVNGEEAAGLVREEGYTIVDVRDTSQYGRAHIKSCCHVPLFVENNDNDFGTIVKRTLHNNFSGLFFGLPFTKLNPDFVQAVKGQFPSDSKLLVVCQEGLRSAAAANMLEKEGFRNLSCITSGLVSVKPGTFDSVGKVELQDAGKAGLVTIQGKISAVLGTVLICAYLFITLFPEQAEKILELNSAR